MTISEKPAKRILPIIVISQFCCTSLWFAGNGIMDNLVKNFNLNETALGNLTSAVQFGFIIGTLTFALLTIADRFSPSKVFLTCAILGAVCNSCMIFNSNNYSTLFTFRFLTGFFLAGIYPVGMKIAADYYQKGLGKSLGFLVGALVIGTALPHLLKSAMQTISWTYVLTATSCLTLIGGVVIAIFVPNGPYRKASKGLDFKAISRVFKNRKFRSAAFGYFGHMWELYAFWAFVPFMLKHYNQQTHSNINISLTAFTIIAIGGLSCVLAGYISQRKGTKHTASTALLLSGICCLLFPLVFQLGNFLFVSFLIFWGMVVIMDSPMFSTMVAQNAPTEIKGTALTIVNCIGFAITIFSIQLLTQLNSRFDSPLIFSILAIGPIFGLIALWKPKN
ncbi:nitrate/nitrite transporter [Mangrovimonas sp. YM274]|uniref:MFS transporter n=1 Tax=Mangrovimonas sp. YM274 TaxID=3070660 RepID=UPI0027DE4C7C|nr:MFS transporter [Mangrovimonas sp. YM274]WMI69533.1 MFS transporter [Mangrovimonas sp. YM274]